jgi:hypothetical protein
MEKTFTTEDIITNINLEGFKIIFPDKTTKEKELLDNFLKLPDQFKSKIKRAAKYLIYFLNSHIILDNFDKDHNKRREWRNEMYTKYGKIFDEIEKNDQLRGSVIGGLTGAIHLLSSNLNLLIKRGLLENNIGFQKINILNQELDIIFSTSYSEMEIEEKLKINKRLKEIAREILDLITI